MSVSFVVPFITPRPALTYKLRPFPAPVSTSAPNNTHGRQRGVGWTNSRVMIQAHITSHEVAINRGSSINPGWTDSTDNSTLSTRDNQSCRRIQGIERVAHHGLDCPQIGLGLVVDVPRLD